MCYFFCLPYERLPAEVHFRYDGKVVQLSEETEECATFYGRMLDHDYTTKEVFNKNFSGKMLNKLQLQNLA